MSGRDRYDDVATLYREMTDLWAVRDAWEMLTTNGQRLILALHEQDPETVSMAWLSLQIGIDEPTTREELTTLYNYGIVSIEATESTESITGETRFYVPREIGLVFNRVYNERFESAGEHSSLEDLLSTLPYQEIEDAAASWGARVTPGIHARAELVGIILRQLEHPDRIQQLIASLSTLARQLWSQLREAGGKAWLDDLLSPADTSYHRRRQIAEELSTPLLLWHGWEQAQDTWRRYLMIPETILHPVAPEPVPVPDLLVVESSNVIEPEWRFPISAAWDLLTLLRETVSSKPRWNHLLEADPRLLRRFEHQLWLSSPESGQIPTGYLPFLVRVGALLGVLRDDGNQATPGPEASGWRQSSFMTAGQRMVAAWTAAESWIEGRDRVELTLYGASWPAYRAILLRNLGSLEPDTWYDEERFISRLLAKEPDLLRQAQVGAIASSQIPMQLGTARPAQDRRAQAGALVVGTTLETACTWLNIIERSHDHEESRPVFKLTPFGGWVLSRRAEPQLPQLGPAPLAVGANFQILLYRPTPRRVWALSSFAVLNSLDRVSTYTITATTLIRSLAGGVNLSDIVEFLVKQSGSELPQNVGYTLVEWDRGYRRVWLRNSVLISPEEGEDGAKIVEVLRDAGLDPEMLADGRLLLVYDEPGAGERLFTAANRALRDQGFAPLAEPEPLRKSPRR